ncbi:hypothetical protein [Methanococcoides alaskense]|uniref:Uncharacterized protein n=1 Tax=Methanococcoides alaskense TaxID=325778 RepID=A0AA90U029_9EURY|nr:hypothetical protein [Methanococcoides alaskense]MDA0525757.1 hypothetical protein [Methanococcoides alaskense]MDR6222985.1 hypothetical protein [Methanococcoides alaskense]
MSRSKKDLHTNSVSTDEDMQKTPAGHALRMTADFSVKTPKGTLQGKAGDYIIKDRLGMVSVVEKNTFNQKYEILH